MRPLKGLDAQDFTNYLNYLESRTYQYPKTTKRTDSPIRLFYDSLTANQKAQIFTLGATLAVKNFAILYTAVTAINFAYLIDKYQKKNVTSKKKALDSYRNSIGSNYGYARAELIEAYGEYCNYCDMRIPDSALAIEHLIPKSIFPEDMIKWENFYLACPNCNSNKGDKPTIDDLARTLKIKLNTLTNANYDSLKEVITGTGDYLWPDNDFAYSAIKYLYEKGASSSSLLAFINDIKAVISNQKGNYKYEMGKIFPPKSNDEIYLDLAPASKPKLVTSTIGLLKLNNHTPPTTDNERLKLSDRRVFNRTKCAISIGYAIYDFDIFMTNIKPLTKSGQDLIDIYLHQLADTAKFAGFFSLYIKALFTAKITNFQDIRKFIIDEYRNTEDSNI